jgi:hypothetical protein
MDLPGDSFAKTCVMCGADCSNKPRVKDRRGRYFCRPCYAAAVKKQKARKAHAARPRAKAPPPQPAVQLAEETDDLMALASGEAVAVDPRSPRQPTAAPPSIPPPMPAARSLGSSASSLGGAGAPAKSRGFSMPSATGATAVLANPWAVFLGVTGCFVVLFLLARGNEGTAMAFRAISGVYGLTIAVWILISAFREGVGTGVLCLCVPFYAFYFVFAKQGNPYLKATLAAAVITNICIWFLHTDASTV